MSTALTIQINSLPALQELFGGDAEAQIAFRKSAAAAFTKMALGNQVTTEEIEKFAEKLRKEMVDEVSKAFAQRKYWGDPPEPTKTVKDAIALQVKHATEQTIVSEVTKQLDESIAATIPEKVEYYLTNAVERIVSAALRKQAKSIEQMLEPLVEAAVTERMNKLKQLI